MKKVIYCKYNVGRAPKFQTKTVIYQDGQKRYIEKYALTNLAKQHMDAFEGNYYLTRELYPQIQFISPEKVGKGIRYPYIVGTPMDEILRDRIHSSKDILSELKKIIDDIYTTNEKYRHEFVMTEDFKALFGEIDCQGEVCLCPCNLDVIFDNLMMVDDKIMAFDYEWVYNFPIPEKYVIYRILCRFYDKYLRYLERYFTFDDMTAEFGFSEEEKNRYRKMEDAFIRNVYAEGDPVCRDANYKYPRQSLGEINGLRQEIELLKQEHEDVISILHNTEKEYLLTIDRLNEAVATVQKQKKLLAPVYCCYGVAKKGLRLGKKMFSSIKNRNAGKRAKELLLSLIEVSKTVQEEQKNTHFENGCKISIITPLFNTPEKFLIELLESVQNQTYSNWEFCLVNFSTTDFERVDRVCREYAEKDTRIAYHVEKENKGIAENTNICISYATGDYIGLLDHDDILHPSALYEVVKVIHERGADFVYTDEVKFNGDIKNVFLPNFKPDFSKDELRAHNYICHFNVYTMKLFREVGGYRHEFDGSQDHDIVLRLTEKASKVVHIPKILYYWRVHPNSVAQSIDAKSYATDAGAAAVTEQLKRMGENQFAESVVNNIPLYRIRTSVMQVPDVTVVIWNGLDDSLVAETKNSLGEFKDCKQIVLRQSIDCLGEEGNAIMKSIETKYALFICAGLKLCSEFLAKELMIYARREDIATIDCKVVTQNDTIYSGGAYLSGDKSMPVKLRCMGGSREYSGYENGMFHTRNVVLSTGLCTFVDVDIWKKSEGFSKSDSMNWILDYSYRMWKNGKNNLWVPFIEAVNMNQEMQKEYISTLHNLDGDKYDSEDAYLSKYVSSLHLE